jgi:hypothetical protein
LGSAGSRRHSNRFTEDDHSFPACYLRGVFAGRDALRIGLICQLICDNYDISLNNDGLHCASILLTGPLKEIIEYPEVVIAKTAKVRDPRFGSLLKMFLKISGYEFVPIRKIARAGCCICCRYLP